MTDTAYWDTVANKVFDESTYIIKDNWHKRARLIHLLLKYDWYKKSVLEIGCGAGNTAAALKVIWGCLEYKGLDISHQFVNTAKILWRHDCSVMEPGKELELPKRYNHLLLLDVLEHVPHEEREFLYAELDKALTSEARVFINNPLSRGYHPNDVEFGFNEADLTHLLTSLRMKLHEVTRYSILNYNYQFIVGTR